MTDKKSSSRSGIWEQEGEEKTDCDENYHSLFEQATDAILVTDFSGNFKDANSSLCLMFGYSKEELLRLNVRAFFAPGHLEAKPLRFDLLEKGESVFNERKMIHRNGTIIYVETNAKKLSDNRVLAIARDVTERKKMEMVLQKSEANLQTIFDTTDTIYVLLDNQLRIMSYNLRARAFAIGELKQTIEISEYFLDYFPADRRPVLLAYMNQVLAGKQINYEANYAQGENLFNWYRVRMFPISKSGNSIYGLMVAVSDITETRKLEKKLLTQKIEEQKNIIRAVLNAQEIERNKIGLELHDNVNQILSTLRLYLGTMVRDPSVRDELIKNSREIIDVAIAEIRSISKQQVTPQRKFDLKELIERLICDLNENVHHCTRIDALVAGDLSIEDEIKLNIYRIVQEQINNILKHAGASIAMISIEERNRRVFITISDDGKGFDPLLKRRGVGISNMFNRVESYNGEITIDSSPGHGCNIKIVLPTKITPNTDN